MMTVDWYADPDLVGRVAQGWVPFGFHVAYPNIPRLEFDGLGDDGLPIWERLPREAEGTISELTWTSEAS